MTAKDCGHHHDERKKLYRRLFAGALGFVIVVLFLILLIWLILRPTKPHFVLQDATVFAFNLSGGNTLTTTVQVTLAARNPNDRIGIYYDRVDVYAAYHGQQITLPTLLPSTYQGHKDSTVWSPFLYGNSVPVAPYLGVALTQDEIAGTVMVNIRVRGRIRWKVGTFISGGYHLYVNCPAYINFGGRNNGIAVGPAAIKYQLIMDCHVDV
ncbi:Late embryogenesis abundant hydroxyproline-rich glycoprotein family [Perilla frutescens var. hirtella]|nr:Late embryogenesis abundant hydroxyproline-rich glycoprotein family [Perilla frutescens var. frutescens]KAH6793673.1 Late embryogenesis abundant hydroxyproline-rich glycoprotein family [Perilla frutescens var. hirtella]